MNADLGNTGLASTLLLAALLGFRHGFDADHIAVVDGMTRSRQLQGSYWRARSVGLQFALGHSAAMLVAALLLFGQSVALPKWLDGLGLAISTSLLLFIAVSNGVHACKAQGDQARPVGPLAAALNRLSGGQLHPVLVGVAFALSLDAMAQAAYFAASGGSHSGIGAVALMALAFGAGMVLADAGNGFLLSWCAQRSDRMARQASRISSGFIALLALLAAGAAWAREWQQGFALAWDVAGIWIGLGLLLVSLLFYGLHQVLQRPASAPQR